MKKYEILSKIEEVGITVVVRAKIAKKPKLL